MLQGIFKIRVKQKLIEPRLHSSTIFPVQITRAILSGTDKRPCFAVPFCPRLNREKTANRTQPRKPLDKIVKLRYIYNVESRYPNRRKNIRANFFLDSFPTEVIIEKPSARLPEFSCGDHAQTEKMIQIHPDCEVFRTVDPGT